MGKYAYEYKKRMIDEKVINKKSYRYIEKEFGVLRGTLFQWIRKDKEGTLNEDNRGKPTKEYDDIEFLKKSYALLKEIRSK